ncbi:MAG: tripartite tricarboxylate transporter substrate binding protein [Roseomonas sp.]|nr:tripartite tricarboxylate transporter substrate binding protein [Roseomonas sp.]MCA3327986.1 tripartite tricarboxylate transporter substrate binding protein [Roseomonas sp.]MCA3332711.1 tripartite tricarboxylate transporter substrate binding protein [Roseomonas sp.]MCA3335004.1 tripartite tricarboxylate transporter substrate binding protein [Roseomonas sp.]MCA3346474.1 tripartite tricarboxylate transporter substrate binding protein [Roseomonas sp.]
MISRRTGLVLGAALLAGRQAKAQAWPTRPIRIIVPFGLGGSADVAARFLAEPLQQALGQPVIVENRPGAGGTIGADQVVKAAPDGHSLLLMSNTHTANETLLPNRPYVLLRDLAPVAFVNVAHHVLVVHPSLGVNSLAELIAYCKANPGKLDYASSGPGTPYHVAGEIFRAMAGIEITHIPFRGSNEARTALIAGQVPMMFDAIPTMAEQARGGRVRALATTGPRRSPLLPEAPTVAEALPGYEASIWLGVMAPAQTPAPIVERLNAEINRVMSLPATRDAQLRAGAEVNPMTATAFGDFLREDITRQAEGIRISGMKAN